MVIDVAAALLAATVGLGGSASRLERAELALKFEKSREGMRARKTQLVFRIIGGAIAAFAGVVILIGGLILHWHWQVIVASTGGALVLICTSELLGRVVYSSALAAFMPEAAVDAERKSKEEQEALARDTALPALLRYNREQMSRYHEIATTQARIAGRNSQIAMTIGFTALIAGASVAIVSNDTTTKIITGGLAALGGIFSGFITRTFFVAQDKAISQLYKYWAQPLASSYFLAAERLVDGLTESRSKDKELGKVIDQLLLIALQRNEPSLPIATDGPKNNSRRTSRRNTSHKVLANGTTTLDAPAAPDTETT
jgi:hypothetical protein